MGESIFRQGYELNVPVLIDAGSWIQSVLDEMVLRLMAKYNSEGNRSEHLSDVSSRQHSRIEASDGTRGRIPFWVEDCQGAYGRNGLVLEKGYPSPIQPDKDATDRDFDAIIRYFMEHHDTIEFMVATHNEASSMLLATLIDTFGLPRNQQGIYFSQLYGMSDHLTFNLAEMGYNVAKYVPYGEVKTMMPYLFRRAEENSSVKGQTSRELKMIRKEIRRRKQAD